MVSSPTRLIRRNLEGPLREALASAPVVLLTGARQSGKSTLARELVRSGALRTYTSLDELGSLDAARRDPVAFVEERRDASVIDEVQRVPELLLAIKVAVDRERQPGRFLLTGSADVLHLPRVSESLAGRVRLLTLWPFSQSELESRRDSFIDAVFGDPMPRLSESGDLRTDAIRRAFRGGMPRVLAEDVDMASSIFEDYVTTVIARELPAIADVAGRTDVPRLVRLLAARSMSLLNIAELSRSLNLAHTTVSRYLALLELVFLLIRIAPWSGSLGRRLVRHPKVSLIDSGLAAELAGFNAERLDTGPTLAGGLLETFVHMEVRKSIGWSVARPSVLHYRSRRGGEVDLVLELRDGRCVGIEVKASSTPRGEDFKGLEDLASAAGRKFVRGVLLYTGSRTLSFGDKLLALPISALWKF